MHRTTGQFWQRHDALPRDIQEQSHKAFALLKANPKHPSLHFKKVGAFWSARIGQAYRTPAIEDGEDLIWVWIGTHAEYERILRSRQ
ncbi:MAG: hypothetical protein HYZ00_13005 [Candidatus Hydrogenedentes bacterium]|nr:hypothetical protein [Candidatus Hydrogenedentota bacterium]